MGGVPVGGNDRGYTGAVFARTPRWGELAAQALAQPMGAQVDSVKTGHELRAANVVGQLVCGQHTVLAGSQSGFQVGELGCLKVCQTHGRWDPL